MLFVKEHLPYLFLVIPRFLLLQLYGRYTDQITDNISEKEAAKLLKKQAQRNNGRPLKRDSQVQIKEEHYSKCQGRDNSSFITL